LTGLAAVRWALTGVVVHHVTVAASPRPSACPGRAANTAVLGEGQRLLINDPTRFDGVRVIGVDERLFRVECGWAGARLSWNPIIR